MSKLADPSTAGLFESGFFGGFGVDTSLEELLSGLRSLREAYDSAINEGLLNSVWMSNLVKNVSDTVVSSEVGSHMVLGFVSEMVVKVMIKFVIMGMARVLNLPLGRVDSGWLMDGGLAGVVLPRFDVWNGEDLPITVTSSALVVEEIVFLNILVVLLLG
jgi:hypothetical protein